MAKLRSTTFAGRPETPGDPARHPPGLPRGCGQPAQTPNLQPSTGGRWLVDDDVQGVVRVQDTDPDKADAAVSGSCISLNRHGQLAGLVPAVAAWYIRTR